MSSIRLFFWPNPQVAEGGVRRVPRGGEKSGQGAGQDLRHPRALQARLLPEVHHGVAGQGTNGQEGRAT